MENRKHTLSWRTGETDPNFKRWKTTDPSHFRRITLKNPSGNLGMGIEAQRTTEALTEMPNRRYQKEWKPYCDNMAWSKNSYGTVPHNLLQFALEWYHVPENIRRMIFKYYDESYIRVKTKEWTTNWIHCGIGVFQGCPLSCILFLAVFNLCLNLLDEYSQLGYCMSNSTIRSSAKAYTDDVLWKPNQPNVGRMLWRNMSQIKHKDEKDIKHNTWHTILN